MALTRRYGGSAIDADVTELVARVPLPPGADMVEVVLRELERVFVEESGLADARPGVRVGASRPSIYLELLENLQVHRYHLMRERERVLENAEIAADWYDRIYKPVVETAERTWSDGDVPGADVFLLLHRRRRSRSRRAAAHRSRRRSPRSFRRGGAGSSGADGYRRGPARG